MTPQEFRHYLIQLEQLLKLALPSSHCEEIESLFIQQWQFEFIGGLDSLAVFTPSCNTPLAPLQFASMCHYLASSPQQGAWPLLAFPNYLLLRNILEVMKPTQPLEVLRQWICQIYGPYFLGQQAQQVEEDLLQEVAGYVVYLSIGSLSHLLSYLIFTDLVLSDEKGQLRPLQSWQVQHLLSQLIYNPQILNKEPSTLRKIRQRITLDLNWTAIFLHEQTRGGTVPPQPSGKEERESYGRVLLRMQRFGFLTKEVKEVRGKRK